MSLEICAETFASSVNSTNDEDDTEQRHLSLIGSVNLKQE